MLTPDATPIHVPAPHREATRFARGRLGLWLLISSLAVVLDRELLVQLPRWVFAVWAAWIACSALLLVALEYVLVPHRRPWLDAVQACLDLPVIALITWHAGAGPYLLAPCLTIPVASSIGWLPRRPAIAVTIAGQLVMALVIVAIAGGARIPPPLGTAAGPEAPRAFLLMVATVQAVSLLTIAWLLGSAVRVARERRERWQRLFDSAPDAIYVHDRAGTVVRMNAAARRVTGVTEAQVRNGHPVQFTADDDRLRARQQVTRTLAGAQCSYEARAVGADGSASEVLVSHAPLTEDDEITGVLTIVHDLTGIRRAEQETRAMERTLDQHRRLLQSIVSTVPTYLYVLDVRTRRVTFANDALLQMMGRTLEQFAALSRDDVGALYHPDDVQALQRAARTLRRHADVRLDLTYRVRGGDGAWRWLKDRVTIFDRDADGQVTRVLGSAIDVTAQRRVSEQLRFSDELYRTVIDNYPGGAVLLFDGSTALRLAAGRGLRESGMDRPDMIGKPLGFGLDAHTTALLQQHCRLALGGVEQQFELRLADKLHEVRAVPMRDADGDVRFGMALTLDVTERRRLEADVRQSQKMEAVGTLAGGIAHDFNNILASVIGYAELALLDAVSDQLQSDLQQVLTAASRGRQMVQRILAFSRRSGEEQQSVDLEPIVSETLRLLLPTLPPRVTIDLRDADHVPPVLGDAGQLHQVILNLCANAIYAMRDTGGVLTVRLTRAGSPATPLLRLEVIDTGAGMPASVLDRAIDPFFTTKPPHEGTGMGLAMVHGIVTGMGGSLRLQSVPGHGTTATIELPADAGVANPGLAPGATGDAPIGNERIMVVDDEPSVAAFLSNALGRFGYRTTAFTSAEAAAQVLADTGQSYDMVVTDMTMPRMSGEDLLREAKRLRPGLPVVICTGYSASMTPERAHALGAAGYLGKPVSVNELVQQVRRILDARTGSAAGGR